MLTAEYLRVLVFLSIIVVVYVGAASFAIRWLPGRFGKASVPLPPRQVWARRIFLALALFGFGCFAYAYFIEPYWLEVTHVKIQSAKLSRGTLPIRIVHISDMHSDPQARLEKRLPEVVARQNPDLIIFTGDCLNSAAALPVFKACLASLTNIAPTFVVKGNWDTAFWRDLKVFEGTGATELDGAAQAIKIGETNVWVAGIAVGNEVRLKQLLDSVPSELIAIFLYHYPDLIPEIAERRVDLYCAGHTHGGQVALPFYGALVTLSKFGKQYESGLYHINRTALYVNRGIGMEGGLAPRVRFCARPEVTVIEISPEAE